MRNRFTGNFNQPMNGTTQFSGSFTFNLNPTPSNFELDRDHPGHNFSTSSFQGLFAGDASGDGYSRTITSIEMMPAPEPSALVIFAALGIAARALRSCRRWREAAGPSSAF